MKTGWKGDVNSEWEEESCCEEDNQGLILSIEVIITKETTRTLHCLLGFSVCLCQLIL